VEEAREGYEDVKGMADSLAPTTLIFDTKIADSVWVY
jgi:hypothetical protein